MRELASSIGFHRNADIAKIVTEVLTAADSNGDGVVDYYEFLPVAADIIQVCVLCLQILRISFLCLTLELSVHSFQSSPLLPPTICAVVFTDGLRGCNEPCTGREPHDPPADREYIQRL